MKNKSLCCIFATSGLTGLFATTALAADQFWNTGGPSDSWNTTDLNWAGAAWTDGNTAIFSGTGETISVASVTAAGITFSGTGYTLSGGTITQGGPLSANESATINSNIALSAAQSWSTAAGKTLTLTGSISGTSALTYAGSGTYVISGINSNSGNLTIDAATVKVGTGATLFCNGLGWSGRSVTITNGGMLEANNFSNNSGNLWGECGDNASNVILQSGGIFKMAGATMDSTVNKGFVVSSNQTGYFRVATGTSSVWGGQYTSRDFNISTGATLVFDGGGNFETSRYIRGAGNLTKNDGGTLKLTGINGFSGSLTINGGMVDAAAATTSGSPSALGGGANTIIVNSGGTLKISGSRGAGYHTGTVTVNAGTITMDGADISLASGKTLTFDTAAGTLNGSGSWQRRDANNKVAVTANASGSSISVATINLLDSSPIFDVANGANGADLTISSSITGGSNLRKEGAGTLVLSGASITYAGTTEVNAGALLVTGTLGGNVTVATGATVGGNGTIGGNLSMASGSFLDVYLAMTNSLDVGGTVTFASGFGIDNLVSNGAAVDWSTVADNTYTLISGTVDTSNLDNLGLANAYDIGGGRKAYFQNGSLQLVVIPEPAPALLLGLGALGICLRRRRI